MGLEKNKNPHDPFCSLHDVAIKIPQCDLTVQRKTLIKCWCIPLSASLRSSTAFSTSSTLISFTARISSPALTPDIKNCY